MKTMPVVYGQEMVVPAKSYSPSSYKPLELLRHLQAAGYPLQIHSPPALSFEDLCLAHAPQYVRAVLECEIPNGFGYQDAETSATFPYTSGSLYQAACLALETGLAASFSSGFHHPGYDQGGGFCTFNGLVIAARRLYQEGRVRRILILDADYHYGDGTDHILERLGLDYIRHETLGRYYYTPEQAEEYLTGLQCILDSLVTNPVDLILYQAGADVHVDDPLGGVLTTEQMELRDRMVFQAARDYRLPLAWNLAGGYQRDDQGSILPVLRLHEQTYRLALSIHGG